MSTASSPALAASGASGVTYAIAIGTPSVGAGAPPPGPREPGPDRTRRGLGPFGQGLATDEAVRFVELDHPPQPRVVRRHVRAELVAVQRHPGLEPERIA